MDPIEKIYNAVPELADIGTLDQFRSALQDPNHRRNIYDKVPGLQEIGSYDQFEEAVALAEPEDPEQAALSRTVENSQEQNLLDLGFFNDTMVGNVIQDTFRAGKRGIASGAGVSEALTVLVKGAESTDENLDNLIESVQNQQKYGISDEMKAFQEAKGFKESAKAFFRNPIALTSEIVTESLFAMGRSGGAAIAGSFLTGPAAAIATPLALGGTSAALETSAAMVEGMQEILAEKGLDFNRDNLREVFEDEEAWADLRNRAIVKGGVIGLVDATTAGIVQKMGGTRLFNQLINKSKSGQAITKASVRGSKLGTTARQAAVEIPAGGIGELAGQAAAGEDLDFKAAALEVIGEIPGAGVSITSANIINKKRLNKLSTEELANAVQNEDKATFDSVVDISKELGQINEDQANDLKNSFDEMVSINATIPESVSDKAKRATIANLIKRRKELENVVSTEQAKEVDPVFQDEHESNIKDVQDQIEDINKEIKETATGKKAKPETRKEAPSLFVADSELRGKEVELPAFNTETGETQNVKVDALDAQNNIKDQLSKLEQVKNCL